MSFFKKLKEKITKQTEQCHRESLKRVYENKK